MFGPGISLCAIYNGCEGAGNNDAFHRWGVCFDGFENTDGAVDRRVEEVLFGVCDVEVEGGGGMDDSFETIDFQCLVESSFDGDVGDDFEGEFRGGGVWVSVLDGVGFGLGADGGYDFVAMFEEDIKDVSGDETGSTWLTVLVF
jgi:hypothetical protein